MGSTPKWLNLIYADASGQVIHAPPVGQTRFYCNTHYQIAVRRAQRYNIPEQYPIRGTFSDFVI